MQKNNKAIYYAKNATDIFYNLKTVPHLKIFAGCTQCERTTDGKSCNLPNSSLIIRAVPELKKITRTEHHITFGAAVTLNEILAVGEKHIPKILYDALIHTATSSIRNLATIGGNICGGNYRTSLYSVLSVLDAKLEFKSPKETKIIPFLQFNGVPEGFILTSIKIFLEDWNVSVYKRLGLQTLLSEESASFCFIADTSRDILSKIRIIFCGDIYMRSKELENKLIGSHLPLTAHTIDNLIADYATEFSKNINLKYPEIEGRENQFSFAKWQFTNLLQYAFNNLL